MIELRRRYSVGSGGGASRLPKEYQEVEYIESAGAGNFNILTQKTVFEYRIKFTPVAWCENGPWSNYYENGNCILNINGFSRIRLNNDGEMYIFYGNIVWKEGTSLNTQYAFGNRYDIKVQRTAITINDNIAQEYTEKTIALDNNLRLFNEDTKHADSYMKLEFFEGFDKAGVKVIELYPCYLKEDESRIGLYDIVDNVFYENEGTGEFVVGPDVIG